MAPRGEGPQRRSHPLVVVGLLLGMVLGSVGFTLLPVAATAQTPGSGTGPVTSGPGRHVHHGPGGEEDVNACSDAVPVGVARCFARVRIDSGAKSRRPVPGRGTAAATLGDSGAYSPSFLQSAYDAPSSTRGSGEKVAVVDAYDDPNAAADLSTYRSSFGLPACTTGNGCFQKVDENGGSNYPSANTDWAQEISVDLDMVSAICPSCSILLVEATSAAIPDLGTAVNTAQSLGANAVSNSYGATEFSSETADNATYYDHPGVAMTAATGDNGYGTEFPASSQYVTSVGGTSLVQNTNTGTRDGSETAWSDGGSGCSAYIPKPAWQADTGCPNRTESDVSAVADTGTPVWVYDTYNNGWAMIGGTSVATPIVASLYALAGNPTSSTDQLASYPYGDTAALNDVTSGSNGSCGVSYLCTAGPGYDGPTGLGSPAGTAAFSKSHAPTPPNDAYHPLTPARITDTRTGSGEPNAGQTLGQAKTLNVQVTGAGGVPASGVTAVALNVTATDTTAPSFLTVWPAGATRPTASNLNFSAGESVPNLVEVGLSTTGQVSIFNAAGSVDVVVDVEGYVGPSATSGTGLYNPLTPARITDTRTGSGEPNAGKTLGQGATLDVQVAGAGGVPASGVEAVVLNVTVTDTTAPSFLTAWPAGAQRPTASNLNFVSGQTVPNRVMVPVGTGGQVSIFNAAGSTDVVVDVGGYFTDASKPSATGTQFTPITPVRITDTRTGSGEPNAGKTLGQGATLDVQVAGAGGVPASGVTAAVLNVTVTDTTQPSYLTVWPTGTTRPLASDLNWVAGETVPNLVVVKLGSDGAIQVFNALGSTDVVVDVSGWYS